MSSDEGFPMDIDAGRDTEQLNDDGGIKHGVLPAEQSLFKENDMKVDAVNEDASGLQGGGITHMEQQSQDSVVYWERFLHVRSIRVLLVENDDSTRNVVSALLRNCNYEVLEAANGFEAWNIIEDLTNHIDLVLTEAVMPSLSGIGLLCKVMSHRTHKNIPVIMMSSHDSTGLVFNCLSKGAVDFLLKPIRKNELKNLWQHIWRRCHSSSGSGSGSGSGTHTQSNSCNKSDDSGSDDESGEQSSWTKQSAEVERSRAMSLVDQVAKLPDSKVDQVVHSRAEMSSNRTVHMIAAREEHGEQTGAQYSFTSYHQVNENELERIDIKQRTTPELEKIDIRQRTTGSQIPFLLVV